MIAASERFDAVVVGGGTAGAWAAASLARRGATVALVDARPLDEAGARWVNGVPLWMYEAAGLPAPKAPELRPTGRFGIRVVGGELPRRFLEPNPIRQIDVRHLVARLHDLGAKAGVRQFAPARVVDTDFDPDGRLRRVGIELEAGGTRLLQGRLFVDASGFGGVLRRRVPRLAESCPKPAREDTCSAAQAVYEIDDLGAAKEWLAAEGLRSLDTDCRLSGNGGYSTDNVAVDLATREVEFLTGVIADGAHGDGPSVIEARRREVGFSGAQIFGGQGVIPLRRPYDRLAADGVALIGNAACQVFAAHGSGTGSGMIAARLLADVVTRHDDPGGREALWDYQCRYMRRWGGLLASYDLVRRFSQRLVPGEVTALLGGGLLSTDSQARALDQRMPRLLRSDLMRSGVALARAPWMGPVVAEGLGAIPFVAMHYRVYPERPRGRMLRRWSRIAARLRGDAADPV